MKYVTVFGDSVSKGVILDEKSKRYKFEKGINWKLLEQKLNIKIDNRSKMGATITYGYKKLKQYLDQKPLVDTIVLLYGGNDCDYNWKEVASKKSYQYQPKTPIKQFKHTLIEMIKLIKSKGIKPIVLTLPSIDAKKYYQWISRLNINMDNIDYFLGDVNHIYRHHELYNITVLEVANQLQIDHIDIRKVFLSNNQTDLMICDDGIHPTMYAEKLIVEHIIDQVLSKYQVQEISMPKLPSLPISLYQKEHM